jgi:hypothetical protein
VVGPSLVYALPLLFRGQARSHKGSAVFLSQRIGVKF